MTRAFLIDRWTNLEDVEPGPGGVNYNVRATHTLSDLEDHAKLIGDGGNHVIRFLPGDHDVEGKFWGRHMAHGGPFKPWPDGTPDRPNTIIIEPGARLFARRKSGATYAWPAIDLAAIKHWDVINANVAGSDFAGIRLAYVQGHPDRPCRVWGARTRDVAHSNIQVQGWWSAPWHPSAYIDVAGGTLEGGDIDRLAPEYGEGVYLGSGYRPQDGRPGWVDRTHHILVRCMRIDGVTSDAVEVKTGVTDYVIEDNLVSNITLPDGTDNTSRPVGFMTFSYANDRPDDGDRPVRGVVRRNRGYSLRAAEGSDWTRPPFLAGWGGIDLYSNAAWEFDHGTMVEARTGRGGFGAGVIRAFNNTAPDDRQTFRSYGDLGMVRVEHGSNRPDDGKPPTTGPWGGTADAGWGPGSGWQQQ